MHINFNKEINSEFLSNHEDFSYTHTIDHLIASVNNTATLFASIHAATLTETSYIVDYYEEEEEDEPYDDSTSSSESTEDEDVTIVIEHVEQDHDDDDTTNDDATNDDDDTTNDT